MTVCIVRGEETALLDDITLLGDEWTMHCHCQARQMNGIHTACMVRMLWVLGWQLLACHHSLPACCHPSNSVTRHAASHECHSSTVHYIYELSIAQHSVVSILFVPNYVIKKYQRSVTATLKLHYAMRVSIASVAKVVCQWCWECKAFKM